MTKCPACKRDLNADAFDDGKDGNPKKTCRGCLKKISDKYAAAHGSTGQRKGGGKPKKKLTTPVPAAQPAVPGLLSLPPGFGFRAIVEDNALQITQVDTDDNEFTVMLSKAEAAVLFAHVSGWLEP